MIHPTYPDWEKFHTAGCDSRFYAISGDRQRCSCGLGALIEAERAERDALRQQVQSLRNELTQIRQGHMGKEDGFLCVLGGSGADYRCPQCVSIDAALASSQTETAK